MDYRLMSQNEPSAAPEQGGFTENPELVPDCRIPRPFQLPEYEWAFFRFVKSSVDALIIAKSSILSKMKPVPAQEIPISRNTTPEGHIIQNDPIFTALPIRIDFKDVLDGRLEAVAETIDEAAQEGLNTILPKVFDHVRRLNDAFGTGIDMNGPSLDHIALRKFVESSEIEFDENGVPDFEPWVLTWDELRQSVTFPELFKQFPPRTPEEIRAWEELIEKKRVEFNAKRRHRKLS